MKRVGFVGLGMMGGPMAANLLRGGFEVAVFDLDRSRVEDLVSRGASAANTLGELADREAVLVMVNTDAQARAVIGELLRSAGSPPPAILCMSTILPATVRELGERATAGGGGFLDAPVSGARILAEAGRLAIMVGGERELFDRALPLFESMGKTIQHVGPLGAGESAKLVNNMIAITTLPVVLEALRIGLSEGLELASLVEVIRASSGNTWLTENWDQAVLLLEFLHRDPTQIDALLGTGNKDLELALELCQQSGIETPLLRRSIETMKELGPNALRTGIEAIRGTERGAPSGAHRSCSSGSDGGEERAD